MIRRPPRPTPTVPLFPYTTLSRSNLVYSLCQHDSSPALDPQGHIHAVIANLTRMPGGKWQALHADKLWSRNTVIGAIYHAHLRAELERLGPSLHMKGKHGTFEIAGVPKTVLAEFSHRDRKSTRLHSSH